MRPRTQALFPSRPRYSRGTASPSAPSLASDSPTAVSRITPVQATESLGRRSFRVEGSSVEFPIGEHMRAGVIYVALMAGVALAGTASVPQATQGSEPLVGWALVGWAIVGWASVGTGTTGGATGPVITVATAKELVAAAKKSGPKTILIRGKISLDNDLRIGSNSTIAAANCGSLTTTTISTAQRPGILESVSSKECMSLTTCIGIATMAWPRSWTRRC